MAKSPIKFGLGEYSDKPFELKSGNTPLFKMMGSPLEQEYTVTDTKGMQENVDTSKQSKAGKGQGWKNALGLVGSMLTSGLDAVYGSGKVVPMSASLQKKKSDEKTKSIEDRLKELENINKA